MIKLPAYNCAVDVENRPPHTGEIDNELGPGWQLAKQPPHMGDYPRIRRAEGNALQVSDLKNCHRDCHCTKRSKSSTSASSIISDEKAELQDYLQLEHLMRLAKARAHKLLAHEH